MISEIVHDDAVRFHAGGGVAVLAYAWFFVLTWRYDFTYEWFVSFGATFLLSGGIGFWRGYRRSAAAHRAGPPTH